jgi:hypothetical protein
MASSQPWPELREEDRWLIEFMEERLQETSQTPEEMRARAMKLRADARRADWKGTRDAALAIAERYEQVATAR